jgi:hypothetical protein
VEGDGECFKILQVENATLSDLTTVFLAALEGFTVPAGTVVLISSASHLAAVGTAAYAEDLVRAFRAIRAVYETGITVMHGIPLLLSGIDNMSTIRSLLEVGAWYQGVSALSTKELSNSLKMMLDRLRSEKQPISETAPSTPENIRAPERFLLKMPQNLHNYDKQVCLSEGFGDQVSLCQPMSEREEGELINSMVDELNDKCGLDLSHEFTLERPDMTSEHDNYDETLDVYESVVMVGGSHSSRLTDELDNTCLDVTDISRSGWRLTEENVGEKVKELREVLEHTDEKRTTVVYQLFDNMTFHVKKPDGSRHLPEKGHDGKYHIEGRLDIANKEEVKKLVNKSIPLLRAGGLCRKIVLTPGARFKRYPCCTTRGHCSNRHEKDYEKWMEGKLAEVKGTIRDYIRMRNIKRVTVIEMGQLITPTPGLSAYLQDEEVWGDDPVHMTPKGYSLAATGLEHLIYEKRAEEKEDEPTSWQGAAKRAKQDLSKKRPDWVRGSVAEAVRKDSTQRGRPPFGHHTWRGGRGGQRGGPRGGPRGGHSGGQRGGGYSGYSAGPSRGMAVRGRGGWKADRSRGRGRPW